MLDWVKIESSFTLDRRIQALLEDHGFSGLGIYIAMRIAIESINHDGLPMQQVLSVCKPGASNRKMQQIIENYGLFNVSEIGLVTILPLAPTQASTYEPTLALTLESTPESTSAPVVSDKIEENEKIVRFRKPTLEEISSYCMERKNGIDPQRFYDYQEARGWMIGKAKMKDWRAAVRTWERNNPKPQAESQPVIVSSQIVPDWAPPKPSPNAQWDFATDSWNDFY